MNGILCGMENDHYTVENTASDRPHEDPSQEFKALQTVITALQPLTPGARARIFESVGTFLQISSSQRRVEHHERIVPPSSSTQGQVHPSFSEDRSMSPKEFLREKQPRTDVERVACLAYYLTHYRDINHFKTLDLSKLNTEAAQPKFSNAANSTNNAVKRGYLVPATKGQRQLSAAGEQFVQALPDRDAAKAAMTSARPRRRNRARTTSSGKSSD